MSDDLGYMVTETDKQVLANLSTMGDKLKELKIKMDEAQAIADQAKKEYEHYANVLLPAEMFAAGVDSLGLASGGMLKVTRKYYCQPNKNEADKKIMSDWLKQYGGEHILDQKAEMPIDVAKESGLPFVEINAINTNRLKAFLKSLLGVDGSTKQVSLEDIPACMHFQEVSQVTIEM